MTDEFRKLLKSSGFLAVLEGTLAGSVGEVDSEQLRSLVETWPNKVWSTDCETAKVLVEQLAATKAQSVLECGSGLSTLIVALLLRESNRSLISLEHLSPWVSALTNLLQDYGLDKKVRLFHRPLVSYGSFDWYDIGDITDLPSFDLVICDGPPGSTTGGRIGLVPLMSQLFSPGCTILLDDGNRNGESFIAEAWCKTLQATLTKVETPKGMWKLEMPR